MRDVLSEIIVLHSTMCAVTEDVRAILLVDLGEVADSFGQLLADHLKLASLAQVHHRLQEPILLSLECYN